MDKYINAKSLYNQVAEKEELARQRVIDTPSRLPNGDVNPYAIRYAAQLDERTTFKFMLADAPAADVAPQWIPVTERLPEEKDAGILKALRIEKRSEYVLATVEVKGEKMTTTACTLDGKWDWDLKYAFPDFKVVAWMPMPEPYKGGEEE